MRAATARLPRRVAAGLAVLLRLCLGLARISYGMAHAAASALK